MNHPIHIVWFKRDLRVVDHRPLASAALQGQVLPLYIAEPELWAQPDASARQWAFAAECLSELNAALSALGRPLCVRIGEAITVLEQIRQVHGIAALWSHEETGNGWTYQRDLAVKVWAKQHGIIWHEMRQTGVQRRIASRNGWAKAWDADMAQPVTPPPVQLLPLEGDWSSYIPSAAELGLVDDPCPFRQTGGRHAALMTLKSFLTQRGRQYRFQMSSPVTAFDACSRLSPHITWGTLSMREVAQASWTRMRHLKQSDPPDAKRWHGSMVSFSGRQHWHCHFMQKLEDEPRIEFENMHRGYDGLRPDVADAKRLNAWTTGQTGYPFIDACMRALNQHGWINFRMRAMLMSFASYHLWLPLRAITCGFLGVKRDCIWRVNLSIMNPVFIGHRFRCSLVRQGLTPRGFIIRLNKVMTTMNTAFLSVNMCQNLPKFQTRLFMNRGFGSMPIKPLILRRLLIARLRQKLHAKRFFKCVNDLSIKWQRSKFLISMAAENQPSRIPQSSDPLSRVPSLVLNHNLKTLNN